MKELDFINTIKNSLDYSSYIGDDCAFIDELDIYVTHDTLVEDVHFSLYTTTPYKLGRKVVNVNLSDLAAALSQPKYITISLSLPNYIEDKFVRELYRGINDVCKQYNVKVIGGDLTGSDKIVISVCAIGKKISLFSASRSFAKKDFYVLTTGNAGSSAAGLYALSNFLYIDESLTESHINPYSRTDEAVKLANIIDSNIALMDTSDGLVDALYKIAQASKHSIMLDINKVPVSRYVIEFANRNNLDYKNFVKWGAEDFELVLCVPEDVYLKLDKNIFTCIGKVLNKDNTPVVVIKDNSNTEVITKEIFESNSFNHFKEI